MILVIAEQKDGKLNRASVETIAAAQQLSMPIKIAVAGQNVGSVATELAQYGEVEVRVPAVVAECEKVWRLRGDGLEEPRGMLEDPKACRRVGASAVRCD